MAYQSVENTLTGGYLAPNTFLNKRDIRKKIFKRYNEKNLFDFLFFTDRKKVTNTDVFRWAEFGYLYSTAKITSATGGGAGTAAVITVTRPNTEPDYTLAQGKKGDLVMINGVRGYIESVSKTNGASGTYVYTVKPQLSTGDFVPSGGVIGDIADDLMIFYSNAHSDGSDQPESMTRLPDWFSNQVQIFKTRFIADGSVSANKAEVEVGGKPYFYLQGVEDAANKHNLDQEFAWLLGEMSDNLTDPVTGKPVLTTRGIEKFVEDFGNSLPYTTVDFAKLKELEKLLSKEHAASTMMMLNGVNFNLDLMDLVKGKLDNSGIDYASFGKGMSKDRMVDFGFDGFRYNRQYIMKECEALNYGPVTGTTGSPYPDMSFVIPLDRIKSPSGEVNDTICLRYKENDRQNRFVKHWTRDQTVTNIDQFEFNHQSENGLMMVGLNQFVKLYKS